jgi:hypothetical protein
LRGRPPGVPSCFDATGALFDPASTFKVGEVKTLTVQEAQSRLGQLIAQANEGEVIVLTDGRQNVTLRPGTALDLEEETPELERELLKAIDGPYSPYFTEEMRSVVERIIRDEKRG